jgi:hypothetical protein
MKQYIIFSKNWEINAEDFGGMLKFALSKHVNLIFMISYTAINHVAHEKPEETRSLFENLFDETKDLSERILSFSSQIEKLIKSIDPKLNGMQDERTISVYLTFRYQEKYTFFKDSVYSKFCELIGEKKSRKGKKFTHYLQQISAFKEKYLVDDEELWQLTKAPLPENAWKDENLNILAQDVLYVGLDQNPVPNYWVFQGNPKFYDIVGSLREGVLKTWSVVVHKDKIKKGDKVILWVTGDQAGCYALCKVISEITNRKDDPSENKFYIGKSENVTLERVEIKIESNLYDRPILKETLKDFPEFAEFKSGNQGTNFTATKEQYERILSIFQNQKSMKKYWIYALGENAVMWNEFYLKGIMGLGWDNLGDLIKRMIYFKPQIHRFFKYNL